MAMVFVDSFDHLLSAELDRKWSLVVGSPIIDAAAGQRDTSGLVCPNGSGDATSVHKLVPTGQVFTLGAAFSTLTHPSPEAVGLMALLDGSDVQVELALNSTGQLVVRRGEGTVLGTSVISLATTTAYYLEFQAVIADVYVESLIVDGAAQTYTRATGSFVDEQFVVGQRLYVTEASDSANNGTHLITAVSALVLTVAEPLVSTLEEDEETPEAETLTYGVGAARVRVNGANVLTLTQVLTQTTEGTPQADRIALGPQDAGPSVSFTWDDLYVCDGSGSRHTDFLGEVQITCDRPADAGELQDWTGDYQLIDDLTPDDAGTVLLSTVEAQQSTFTFPALELPVVGVGIVAVALTACALKDSAITSTLKGIVDSGATIGGPEAQALTASYACAQFLFPEDPDTEALWTVSACDAAEWGVETAAPEAP